MVNLRCFEMEGTNTFCFRQQTIIKYYVHKNRTALS